LELQRKKLAKREDYNVFEIYRMYFDTDAKGYLTQQDFKEGVKKLGIYVKFDPDTLPVFKNGEVRYSQFCELMLPKSDNVRWLSDLS
jgi:Ca2+-binding EF-hand superfamily protein